MPTSIKVLLLVFGGVMLLAALLGSGFSIREISFPPMNPLLRTVTVLLGAGLMVTSVVPRAAVTRSCSSGTAVR